MLRKLRDYLLPLLQLLMLGLWAIFHDGDMPPEVYRCDVGREIAEQMSDRDTYA